VSRQQGDRLDLSVAGVGTWGTELAKLRTRTPCSTGVVEPKPSSICAALQRGAPNHTICRYVRQVVAMEDDRMTDNEGSAAPSLKPPVGPVAGDGAEIAAAVRLIVPVVGNQIAALVKSIDALAGFWTKWGLTTGLLILGLASAVVGVVGKIERIEGWDDATVVALLGFAFLALTLGVLARVESNRRTDRREALGVQLTELEVNKQLELHATVSDVIHKAVSEALAATREAPKPAGSVPD
jgi:hypothetical protein